MNASTLVCYLKNTRTTKKEALISNRRLTLSVSSNTPNLKLEKLSLKADLRNPDEFYHKMKNARFEDGTHTIIKSNSES